MTNEWVGALLGHDFKPTNQIEPHVLADSAEKLPVRMQQLDLLMYRGHISDGI